MFVMHDLTTAFHSACEVNVLPVLRSWRPGQVHHQPRLSTTCFVSVMLRRAYVHCGVMELKFDAASLTLFDFSKRGG